MRIAIGQVMHETNTMFGPPTPLSEFQRQGWHSGNALVERYGGSRNYLSGMLDAGRELGVEVVPTFAANAHPSGTIAAEAFEAHADGVAGRAAGGAAGGRRRAGAAWGRLG